MAGRGGGRYGSLNRSRCHLTKKNECESQIRMQPARRSKGGTAGPNRFSSQVIPLPNFIPLYSSMVYSVACISRLPAFSSFNLVLLAGNGLRMSLREALGKGNREEDRQEDSCSLKLLRFMTQQQTQPEKNMRRSAQRPRLFSITLTKASYETGFPHWRNSRTRNS